MIRTAFAALAVLCLAACGAPAMDGPAVDPGPELDAPDALPVPVTGHDAAPATPDAKGPDAGHEAASPEAAAPIPVPVPVPGPDAAPEAAPPMGTPDAAPTMPEAGPVADAGTDAAPPLCPAATATCAGVNAIDDTIRATFPPTRYACTDGARLCGTVLQNRTVGETIPTLPVTYPMVCRNGAWRFAGGYSAGTWFPLYECSVGCPTLRTCAP